MNNTALLPTPEKRTIIHDLVKQHQKGCVDKYSETVRERYQNGSVNYNGTVNLYDITPTISMEYVKSRANGLAPSHITKTAYLFSQ